MIVTKLKHMVGPAVNKMLSPYMSRQLQTNGNDFYRLLSIAVDCQRNILHEEDFRKELDVFYKNVDLNEFKRFINYDVIKQHLKYPDDNRFRITRFYPNNSTATNSMFNNRLFGYLSHYKIYCYLEVIPRNKGIAPHAHHRLTSGFLCLDGSVGIRHYDRVKTNTNYLQVRKTIDEVLEPGDYTTNSEFHDDVHWLHGEAEQSICFLIHLLNTPNTLMQPDADSKRLYVDVTTTPDSNNIITAPFISEEEANKIPF